MHAVNVGINGMLFPAIVESDVVLTNARDAAEDPIAETVVGFIAAMRRASAGSQVPRSTWDADSAAVFYDNVGRSLRGDPLRNVVDKRLGFPA